MFLTIVRAAAVARLTGLPTSGPRVYQDDVYARDESISNWLMVDTSSTPEATSLDLPPVMRVDTVVQVQCMARGDAATLPALLDTMAAEVMAALCASGLSFGGQTRMCWPTELRPIEFTGEQSRPLARRTLSFVVSPLYVRADQPATFV